MKKSVRPAAGETVSLRAHVVVIGGGPSGATAARTLAKQGVSAVLIEKNLHYEKPCGGGLFRSAFAEFDIPDELCLKEVDTITLVSPTHKRVDVELIEEMIGIVHRSGFDASLRQLAVDDGAELIEGRCVSIVEKDGGIVVGVKTADRELSVEACYCIAADGVNSFARKKLTSTSGAKTLTLYKNLPGRKVRSCEFWLGSDIAPGHYAWNFPHSTGSSIGTIAADTHTIHRYFEKFSNNFEQDIKPKGFYIPSYRGDLFYAKHTFFTGDAAGLVMPFTYEGIYYAMKSGRLAAEAIIKDDPHSYEMEWKRLYHKRFRFMNLLQRIFMRYDRMGEFLVKVLKKPSVAQSALRYWRGESEPLSFWSTVIKVLKLLYR